MSPTQRSLAWLRKEGWQPGIVERWIAQARKRVDLFNIIDVIAIRQGTILGVQITSGSNVSAHRIKALEAPGLRAWLEAGGEFVIHGWRKVGARGKRKLWDVRIVSLSLEDLL